MFNIKIGESKILTSDNNDLTVIIEKTNSDEKKELCINKSYLYNRYSFYPDMNEIYLSVIYKTYITQKPEQKIFLLEDNDSIIVKKGNEIISILTNNIETVRILSSTSFKEWLNSE